MQLIAHSLDPRLRSNPDAGVRGDRWCVLPKTAASTRRHYRLTAAISTLHDNWARTFSPSALLPSRLQRGAALANRVESGEGVQEASFSNYLAN